MIWRSHGKNAALVAMATAMLALAGTFAGCGGESLAPFTKGGPPPPPECMQRWNADQSTLDLGKHFYSQGHDSRAAHVAKLNLPEQGLRDQCLVVMAARESDREYGTIGEFTDASGGWQLISNLQLGSNQKLLEVQRKGSKQANAELRDDGSIAPF